MTSLLCSYGEKPRLCEHSSSKLSVLTGDPNIPSKAHALEIPARSQLLKFVTLLNSAMPGTKPLTHRPLEMF